MMFAAKTAWTASNKASTFIAKYSHSYLRIFHVFCHNKKKL